MEVQTIYLLRQSSYIGNDGGMILGAFFSQDEAIEWVEKEYEEKYVFKHCGDHGGMWDCVSSAYLDEDAAYTFSKGFVITTCLLYEKE